MYGKNPVTKPFRDGFGKLLVNELFLTIQGEGPDAGTPAIFLRLAKCNLRCFFCDTEFEKGELINAPVLADRIKEMAGKSVRLVVITGGEPLLQNISPLTTLLNNVNMRVSVESAGTMWHPDLLPHFMVERDRARHQRNQIIISPKTPKLHSNISDIAYAWKYIVRQGQICPEDGLPIESTQTPGGIARIARPSKPNWHKPIIYVQPMDEGDPERNSVNQQLAAQIAMKHGYKLSLQVHKIVGLP